MVMRQIFLTELKGKCEEINMSGADNEKINQIAVAYKKILELAYTARHEGLLALEEAAEKLDKTNQNDRFLQELLMMIVEGCDKKIIKRAGINRCVVMNLPDYDGLINLMYLEGVLMILAGDHQTAMTFYLKSMLPDIVSDAINFDELSVGFSKFDDEKYSELLEKLCDEGDVIDGQECSVLGKTALAVMSLSDEAIQRLLREVDNAGLCIVLKGLAGAARKRIFDNISRRLSLMIVQDMSLTGPVRKTDAERECVRVMKIIIALENKGELVCPEIEQVVLAVNTYEEIERRYEREV